MLSEKVYEKIANEFIGDNEESEFIYKTGGQLVKFFNEYFSANHSYGGGFPSRWFYVSDNLKKLDSVGRLSEFFSIILSKEYILEFEEITHGSIEEEILVKLERLNRLLLHYSIEIKIYNGKIFLLNNDNDLELIDSGGFAEVYRIKGMNKAKKVLKFIEKVEHSSRSRFKREFEITDSLKDLSHVINVNNYNPNECSYEMDLAESNLYNYMKDKEVDYNKKLWIIRHVVKTMASVHSREIIHRDLTPNNILMVDNVTKICDFGIGKELDQIYSHNTLMTNNIGQVHYSAPEQLKSLKNAEMPADVYSLGRLINFIFTTDPLNYAHELKAICLKATAKTPTNRYSDANELLSTIEIYYKAKGDSSRKERITSKLKKLNIDEEVFDYIINLSKNELDSFMDEVFYSDRALINAIEREPNILEELFSKLYNVVYLNYELPFHVYDRYATVSQFILTNNELDVGYDEQSLAAEIINFVAKDVNRFSVQDQLESLLQNEAIDDSIKAILNRPYE